MVGRGATMIVDLPTIFELEAEALEVGVRRHPALGPLLASSSAVSPAGELRAAYLRYLKVTADYVKHTVPMLRAAAEALRDGDEEDRLWHERFMGYAAGETDPEAGYGHQVWALDDMRALGAHAGFLDAPAHERVDAYGSYFVDEARRHPYAILGAKGVLEHLSLRIADPMAAGVRASDIPNAANAVTFLAHHGVLDIDHVRAGDGYVTELQPQKRDQVVHGAYFTSGCYRTFLRYCI